MFLVDPLTTKTCSKALTPPNTCAGTEAAAACKAGGGECRVVSDGYYTLSIGCTALAILWYILMQSRVRRLRELAPEKWQVRAEK